MASEWREERCKDCGATFERRWIIQTHKIGTPVPKGYRTEHRGQSWTTIAGPTADASLCMCDTAY